MIRLDPTLTAQALRPSVQRAAKLAAEKVRLIRRSWDPAKGAPVFTVGGAYTARGWTEWTQGFQFGAAIHAFELTGEKDLLEYARAETVARMASHVTHRGVHDHGFNNVSTYGNLLRLLVEGKVEAATWERRFYELALKASGAVQAARWTALPEDLGFIQSFNGPHSLFSDTIRSLRALVIAHLLGHALMAEQDARVNLLRRALQHAETTARCNVYFGTRRDAWDIRGRVAHESIFNTASGAYRCPSTQQGYSPFSTWTRGLAWVLLGYAEQLEYLAVADPEEIAGLGFAPMRDKAAAIARFLETAEAAADFFIEYTPTDGIPYWDTGAPGLSRLGAWADRPAEPFNDHEPVDSSAAAIAAQGLLRLAAFLSGKAALSGSGAPRDAAKRPAQERAARYQAAGLAVARTLFAAPYLSEDPAHQGLILHSVYHRPNGWDHVPVGRKVPCGESSMWGDYHAIELAAYLDREAQGAPPLRFFTVREDLA
jgi:unsaturated chondroitin disaccharide hydrolase